MAAHEGRDRVVLTVVSQSRGFASTVLKVWQYMNCFDQNHNQIMSYGIIRVSSF